MNKMKIFFAGLPLWALGLVSCSQQADVWESPEAVASEQGVTTVAELTRQLRADNQGVTPTDGPATRFYDTKLSKKDKFKIAMADVKGGLCGSGGGPVGVITGAVGSSLKKYAQIWMWYQVKCWIVEKWGNVTGKKNGVYTFADSVGYYHNLAEQEINSANPAYSGRSTQELMLQADSIVRSRSDGYKASSPLSQQEVATVAASIDRMADVDTKALSADDYCARLKELNPADSAYIDFNAEYLYHILYANDDADAYTEQLLYKIEHGNLDVKDASLLAKTVRIGYASIKFSNNMKKQ